MPDRCAKKPDPRTQFGYKMLFGRGLSLEGNVIAFYQKPGGTLPTRDRIGKRQLEHPILPFDFTLQSSSYNLYNYRFAMYQKTYAQRRERVEELEPDGDLGRADRRGRRPATRSDSGALGVYERHFDTPAPGLA